VHSAARTARIFAGGFSGEKLQDCCWNATPGNNLSGNGSNAQKGGKCLTFLLLRLGGAIQIGFGLAKFVCSRMSIFWGASGIGLVLGK
jgi:hypothetical protein